MNRRQFIVGTVISLSTSFAGCVSELEDTADENNNITTDQEADNGNNSESNDESETVTKTNNESDSENNIRIILYNNTSKEKPVQISVSTAEVTIFREDMVVSTDEDPLSVDPEITERGEYHIEISIDENRESSFTFDVEEYDLRQGSNVLVTITNDDIEILIEE